MSVDIPLLSNVQVAAPCAASWKHMDIVDGDRVHFCAGCKKNVYNLSALTQTQAEGLLRKHEGHLCVRYYKRTDGTILTQNCPVGQAALRMKMIARSKSIAVIATMLGAIYYGGRTVEHRAALGMCLIDTSRIPDPAMAIFPRRQELPTVDSSETEPHDGDHTTGSLYNEFAASGLVKHNLPSITEQAKSLGIRVSDHAETSSK